MRFSILTLGCKVNLYESEGIINNLKSHGYTFVENNDDENIDLFIVNSCTVTSVSDQKTRQMLHQARRNHPNAVICVCGCYSQLKPMEALDNADIVLGTTNKLEIFDIVNEYLENHRKKVSISEPRNHPCFEEMDVESLETHTRAFIKIQDGCENYCSYCAIPYARGSIRSRNPENVINEINRLCSKGVKEVILAGINTGTYGRDLHYINLSMLIERIMNETPLFRLRLSSIELSEITDELLDTLSKYSSRIAHHLHIPLQAGCDSVLERMHRHYTTKEYKERISDIRKIFPDVALTTDILAGFVGETQDEFNKMLHFIDSIKFYEMHIFPYSKRENTEAYYMEGHLEKDVKQKRAKEISIHAHKMSLDYMNMFINTNQVVIAEQVKNEYFHGKSSNYLDIAFTSDIDLTGKIVNVIVERIENNQLYGKVVSYE